MHMFVAFMSCFVSLDHNFLLACPCMFPMCVTAVQSANLLLKYLALLVK